MSEDLSDCVSWLYPFRKVTLTFGLTVSISDGKREIRRG